MKSLINKGVHELLRMAHTPVVCSDAERTTYLNRAQEINAEVKQWLGSENRELVGLGQNCNASWYIKSSGNKRASYPFDWLFTTPNILLDILDDNFQAFTNKELLIPHGLDAGHERYHETLFGHRNPASNSSDRDYFQRCIVRWNELMKSQKPILFLTIVLNESDKRKRWKDGFTKKFEMPENQQLHDFDALTERLQGINPNCKFLFIEQYTESNFELTTKEKVASAFWIRFSSIDKNTGVQYLHSVDDEVMKSLLNGLTK